MLTLNRLHFLLGLLLLIALPFSSHADERLEASIALVDNLIDEVKITVEGTPSHAEIRSKTNSIIDRYFDYNFVARFAAGNAWRSASKAERDKYKIAFREVLLLLAEKHFDFLKQVQYSKGKAIPKGKSFVIVEGHIRDSSGQFPDARVAWRIRTPQNRSPRIVDIEVENISMLLTQQQEHTAIVNQYGGSFKALIDQLAIQAQNLRADQTL